MRSFTALTVFALATALPSAASAQGLELFDFPNFQGSSVMVDREIPNLGPGAFDDLATSVRITAGAWELCDGPNFVQPCTIVTSDVWDLQALSLNNRVSSIRPAFSTAPQPAPYPGQPPFAGATPFPGQPRVTLYEDTNFRGRSVTITDRADNLRFEGFEDRARSIQVAGEWRLCEGMNLTGRCEIIAGDMPDLNRIAMSRAISSLEPSLAAAPAFNPNPQPFPPQQSAQMLAGNAAGFYPFPYIPANRLNACLRGNARACEQEVDVFCRSQPGGWREGAYYTTDPRNAALTDILCIR
jgi:hypothetical protein